ncbi:hypothetical protein JCM16418_581 [Paenibacillus pini JCM 16418]|uniref:Uncharacterized protein n=2 Tax=Paenibacillus TaxID=44249 RepID=W7YPY7_9BACL|nr:hypothetical protein JCM16418_581 [Paenibacillus pini JCM 16418]
MKYQLGNNTIEKVVNIKINGKIYSSINGNKTFKGTIDVEGENLPVPSDQRQLIINLSDKLQGGVISYAGYDQGKPFTYAYGGIFFNKNFSKATLYVYNKNDASGGWNVDDGLMISLPASTRSEALDISNELMRNSLNGYILK